MADTWLTLLIIMDVSILGILIYYLSFSKKMHWSKEINIEKLEVLYHSLKDLIKESNEVSIRLSQYIESKEKIGLDMENRLKEREEALIGLISKADNIINYFNQHTDFPGLSKKGDNDQYITASKMIKEGYSPEEISTKLDIPLSEVQLIADLKK